MSGSVLPEDILKALRASAHEMGIARLARKTGLSRETLYRTVGERGNPRLATLVRIMRVLSLDFSISPKSKANLD